MPEKQNFSEPGLREIKEIKKPSIEWRLANAFSKQHYPLSESGQLLLSEVSSALEEKDPARQQEKLETLKSRLPTVENPHLDLFEDLALGEQEKKDIFTEDLKAIQVTKGCSHQCLHCAAGSEKRIVVMPFAAVLKIAEKMREGERLVVEKKSANFINTIVNYYDGEVFDYRDSTFLHEDGTPADYGDVFQTLSSPDRPIHITTAGWRRGDKVAQRAAEKIVAIIKQCPETIDSFRLSVHPFRIDLQKEDSSEMLNYQNYYEDLKNVLSTLTGIKMTGTSSWKLGKKLYDNVFGGQKIKLSFASHENLSPVFLDEIYDKLIDDVDTLSDLGAEIEIRRTSISGLSGRASDPSFDLINSRHDVMTTGPGFYVLPDGTAAKQPYDIEEESGIKKGSRPKPIGQKLFEVRV